MISHDRYFLNAICDQVWEISNGTLHSYIGNYDDYIQKKNSSTQFCDLSIKSKESSTKLQNNTNNANKHPPLTSIANTNDVAQSSYIQAQNNWEIQKANKQRIRKLTTQIKKIEDEIHSLESQIEQIDANLCQEEILYRL